MPWLPVTSGAARVGRDPFDTIAAMADLGEPEGDGADLRRALDHPRYPRANTYDARWTLESNMGPNVLWLTEALCEHLPLEPGMRVLDLGCGNASSSIFLAKEFGVSVWAVDLTIKPTPNWQRVRKAGMGDRVFPLRADARTLPFADDFFDAIVSISAYQYFGTDDLYLSRLLPMLAPGGRLGVVVEGVREEIVGPPDHFSALSRLGHESLHGPDWWRHHWTRSGLLDIELVDEIPGGFDDWLAWKQLLLDQRVQPALAKAELGTLRADQGRWLTLVRAVGRKLEP